MKKSFARMKMALSAFLLVSAGCGEDKGNGPVEPEPFNEAVITFYMTSPLPAGFEFELWAKAVDTSLSLSTPVWVPLTRFNLNSSGGLLDSNGTAIAGNRVKNLPVDLDDYDSLQVTIEQTSSHVAVPSQQVFLRSSIPPDLTTSHLPRLVFPHSFGQGTSYFMMFSPTDTDTADELSGLWFVYRYPPGDLDSGLTLPPAPVGWLYEGWVRHGASWLSTGRFRRSVGGDLNNPYCGVGVKPAFPGEDFVQNAPPGVGFSFPFEVTAGDKVRVTLEPDLDSGTGTFGVDLLTYTFGSLIVPMNLLPLEWSPEQDYPLATMDIQQAGL